MTTQQSLPPPPKAEPITDETLRSQKYPHGVDGFDVRSTFLALTTETTPHGFEWKQYDALLTALGFTLDKTANYQGSIPKADGTESETLFIAHMDTVGSVPPKRIERVYVENHVGTNGNTILGADDKAGMTVLLYALHKRVPGHYVFTWGEEIGRKGSQALAAHYSFKKFKRAIAFDRKGHTSIITRQSGQQSCSSEFADALIQEFAQHGLTFEQDPFGSFTDTVSFFGEVPECTNISVGYTNAHGGDEIQDLAFLEDLCHAVGRVDWESLPAVQDTKKRWGSAYGGNVTRYGTMSDYYSTHGERWSGSRRQSTHPYQSNEGGGSGNRAGAARTNSTSQAPKNNDASEQRERRESDKSENESSKNAPWRRPDEEDIETAQSEWDSLVVMHEQFKQLTKQDVEMFVMQYPEAAADILYEFIKEFPVAAGEHAFRID